MPAHPRLDQRRVYLCVVEFRERAYSLSAKRRRKLLNNPSQYHPNQPQRDKKSDDW
jgi:hypothetical protein